MSRRGVTRGRRRGPWGHGLASLCLASLVSLVLPGGGAADAQAPGWKDARPGYAFSFPRDHASHPDYKIEWWYYTGNLAAEGGRRFGYQLTFFRVGVDPQPENPSRWAVRDLFMTHLAVTNVEAGTFRYAERLNRAGVGWAGATTDAYRVWNEDWEVRLDDGDSEEGAAGAHLLRAIDTDLGVELRLDLGGAPVIHGTDGISQKGSREGNASHYYSLTRMPTRGTLIVDGERVAVEGVSWMDHEFGTSFLEEGQVGWDWFSIQLDDGADLMLFQLRRRDGSRDPRSSGTLVTTDPRTVTRIAVDDFELQPGRPWRSPGSNATYPTEWKIHVGRRGLDVVVRAAVDDQELRTDESTGVTYWEGAVEVTGTRDGAPVTGRGYLEMTGYAGQSMGDVLR